MAAHRKYAGKPRDIFSYDYDAIIKSAKRKHTFNNGITKDEFYIFKTDIGGSVMYSECCVDVYGDAFEHWIKGERWHKVD